MTLSRHQPPSMPSPERPPVMVRQSTEMPQQHWTMDRTTSFGDLVARSVDEGQSRCREQKTDRRRDADFGVVTDTLTMRSTRSRDGISTSHCPQPVKSSVSMLSASSKSSRPQYRHRSPLPSPSPSPLPSQRSWARDSSHLTPWPPKPDRTTSSSSSSHSKPPPSKSRHHLQHVGSWCEPSPPWQSPFEISDVPYAARPYDAPHAPRPHDRAPSPATMTPPKTPLQRLPTPDLAPLPGHFEFCPCCAGTDEGEERIGEAWHVHRRRRDEGKTERQRKPFPRPSPFMCLVFMMSQQSAVAFSLVGR